MTQRQHTSIARACRIALLAMFVLTLIPFDSALSQDGPPAALPQPSEAQLGVPTYPGAKYDGMASGGMTQPDTFYWVFTTADSIDKVAAFYKGKPSLTSKEISGSYMFSVKKSDSGLFPDHGVLVEPNKLWPPPTKTIITVVRKK